MSDKMKENFRDKKLTDIEIDEYKFKSKILQMKDAKELIELFARYGRHGLFSDTTLSVERTDEICSVFDSIYNKEIIEDFPNDLSDNIYYGSTHVNFDLINYIRREYVAQAGFSIITKRIADNLAEYLKGKKCLEIMAGKGVLSKVLQDRGIDIVATDNYSWDDDAIYQDAWADVEVIEAGDAIRKYKNVDYILVSWMPVDAPSKRLVRMIRKYNPNVKLIVIGEERGGCTSNDAWFDRVHECLDIDFITDIYGKSKSWYGVHDKIELYSVTKPWLAKMVAHVSNGSGYAHPVYFNSIY